MLIAMAGLPGTGKSTLARQIAEAIRGVVLCKDIVRATLFPAPVLDYSTEQDEIAMHAIYSAAKAILRADPSHPVFIDGRTFSRAHQIRDLITAAESAGASLRVIECVCAEEIARARIAQDTAHGSHPAGNRTPDLHTTARARAEPLTIPRLVLDTGTTPPAECLGRVLAYLARGGSGEGAYTDRPE